VGKGWELREGWKKVPEEGIFRRPPPGMATVTTTAITCDDVDQKDGVATHSDTPGGPVSLSSQFPFLDEVWRRCEDAVSVRMRTAPD